MCPYVITTKQQPENYGDQERYPDFSRHAVATLEEAQDYLYRRAKALGWSGPCDGSVPVGPLPDGTVIAVERVTWEELAGPEIDVDTVERAGCGDEHAQRAILDAYNARQS